MLVSTELLYCLYIYNVRQRCYYRLKKAIKAGKTECGAIAANIDKIISEGLLEFLDLSSDNPADRLQDLITLPLKS